MAKATGRTTEEDGVVVFLMGGREVSNDPNFGSSGFAEQLKAQREALEAQDRAATDEAAARVQASKDAEQAEVQDYQSMKGPALKALAEARELDLSGVSKKSQLITLLQEADAKARPTEITGADLQRTAAAETPAEDEDDDEDDEE